MNRVFVLVLVASVLGVGATAIAGSERQTGVALAVALVSLCVVQSLKPLFSAAAKPMATLLTSVLALVTIAWSVVPVLEALEPGAPVASGELKADGDAVTLPASAHGPVRVLVHASMPSEPSALHVVLNAGAAELKAKLESSTASVRLGRRGHGQVIVRHESEYIDTVLPEDAKALSLTSAVGAHASPIHVEVFREWVPLWALFAGGALLLLGVSALGTMVGAGMHVSIGIAGAIAFGLAAHASVTPDAAVRPEIGALFVAMLAAALAGTLVSTLMDRLLKSRAA